MARARRRSAAAPAATHAPAGTGRRRERRGGRSDRSSRPSRTGPGTRPARTTTSPRRRPGRGSSSAPRCRPHERAAARRAHPLVQVAGVDIASDRREVEVDLPRAVRAVDDRECAVLAGERAQPGDRQDEGAQRRDVAHEQDARARREPRRDRVEQLVLAERRPRQRCDDDLRAREGATSSHRIRLAPYSWSVRRISSPRRSSMLRATALSPVVTFGTSPMSSPDAAPTYRATLCRHPRQPSGELAGEEQHRLALELAAELVLGLEDGARHGTEAAVVEVRHLGVEHEQLAELLGARCHAPSLPGLAARRSRARSDRLQVRSRTDSAERCRSPEIGI